MPILARMRVPEERPEPPEHHFLRELTAGIEHVWRTLPLRQIVLGATIALLVVGFAETLIDSVIGIVERYRGRIRPDLFTPRVDWRQGGNGRFSTPGVRVVNGRANRADDISF